VRRPFRQAAHRTHRWRLDTLRTAQEATASEKAAPIGEPHPFTEAAASLDGDIMSAALRQERPMSAPGGMIVAIVPVNDGRSATRNLPDFHATRLELVCR
jgi:hypothetical protein